MICRGAWVRSPIAPRAPAAPASFQARRKTVAAAVPGKSWRFPWSQQPSDEYETEYETVYVTDSESVPASSARTGPTGVAPATTAAAAAARTATPAAPEASASARPTATRAAATSTAAALAHPHHPTPAAPPPPPAASSAAAGWAVALTVLAAVRAGRRRADLDRFDLAALQARQQESRVQDRELREKRKAYLEEQARVKELEAAKRLEEAKRRAAEEAAARAEQRAREAAESAKELERMKREREAARQEFERGQAQMDDELRKRIAVEEGLLREREQRRAEAEAAARAAEEEARRVAEEAARREAEAAARRAAEAERQKRERRERLAAAQTTYEVRLEGEAIAGPAPPGSTATSRGGGGSSLPARLRVQVELHQAGDSSSSGGGGGDSSSNTSSSGASISGIAERLYESSDAAVEDAGPLAFESARAAAARLLASPAAVTPLSAPPAGAAPLLYPELQLWGWLVTLESEAAAARAVAQVAPLASASSALTQPFGVTSRCGVLPEGDPSSVERMLRSAAAQARSGQATAAAALLDDLIGRLASDCSDAAAAGAAGSGGSSGGGRGLPPLAPCLVPACVYALFLDLCEDPFADAAADTADTATSSGTSSSGSSSSSSAESGRSEEGGGPLRRLVAHQLSQRVKGAPKDSLAAPAASVARLLGPRHPVARLLAAEAEANMSMGARAAREMRQQQGTVAASMEVLKQQGSLLAAPGGLDPSSNRARGAPVPEKAWAARNVARSLLMGGGVAGAEEAVRMLSEAAGECSEYYGATHPGQLSTLLDLLDALLALLAQSPERSGIESEAATVIHQALAIVQAVGERYRSQGDLASMVLLYESAQAELDYPQVLPRDDPAMSRIVQQASEAFGSLETSKGARVQAQRGGSTGAPTSPLRRLARDCTEEPLVQRATRRGPSWLDKWNKDMPLPPL